MRNHLLNRDFLIQLSTQQNQKKYARLCIFDKKKRPLEYLIGYITGGNINIDGDSVLRRTCTLNIVADNTSPLTQVYWALSHEFQLEIGLENNINSLYEDIVWFPMGHYLISSFSTSQGQNNISVSISGQDLGAKLNGACGGSLSSQVDFGIIENEQTDGTIILQQVEIETIIKQALQQYALEPLENIIINDLPEYGLELLEYKGTNPMYIVIEKLKNNHDKKIKIINYTLDADSKVYYNNNGSIEEKAIKDIPQYWSLAVQDENYNEDASEIFLVQPEEAQLDIATKYYIAKIEFGNTIGYRKTPLVYAGDLILKAGDNIGALLDTIKTMLGEYEYFYDTDGRFVFQQKQIYIENLFSPNRQTYIEPIAISKPYVYDFTNCDLFTSISSSPQVQNVKNDFTIWGTKKSANNSAIDIHARYVIDKKPQRYHSPWGQYEKLTNLVIAFRCMKIDNNYYLDARTGLVYLKNNLPKKIYTLGHILQECVYGTLGNGDAFYILDTEQTQELKLSNTISENSIEYIYQQVTEQKYHLLEIKENSALFVKAETSYNAITNETIIKDYTTIYQFVGGIIYLSHEYTGEEEEESIRCDWRELIYQMAYDHNYHNEDSDFYYQIQAANPEYLNGITGYEQYYSELLGFWRLLYDPSDKLNCFGKEDGERAYWNRNAYLQPETMLFWFDFLDTGDTEINKYSVKNIGIRPKVETKSQAKTTIFQSDTPEILFVSPNSTDTDTLGHDILQLPASMEQLVSISSQGRSLVEQINDLFYNHAYCSESVTLSSIPMFWMEPNTRIRVKDIGDLSISKISFNLDTNSPMSLTCTKIINPISY